MPPRVANSPGAVPLELLVLKLGLCEPQHKIRLIALVLVGLNAVPHAHRQILGVLIPENVVMLQPGRVKVHIAPGYIRAAFVQQGLHHLNKVAYAGGCRHDRSGLSDVELRAVLKEGLCIHVRQLQHGFMLLPGPLEHLVLPGVRVRGQVPYVGNIHHPVHPVPLVLQGLFQHVLHDIGAQVTYMRPPVDRGPAGVHLHDARLIGGKIFLLHGKGIRQLHTFTVLSAR